MEQSQVPKEEQAQNQKQAKEFALSSRWQLVVAQALCIASKKLADKEPKNASDMKYIGSNLFEPYWSIYNSEEYSRAIARVEKDCMEHNKKIAKQSLKELNKLQALEEKSSK